MISEKFLIPDGPLNPGVLHTIATGSGGYLGLYSMEIQVTAGSGSLSLSGLGANTAAKKAIKVGFDYFKAAAGGVVSASIKFGDYNYRLHIVELHNAGPANAMTLTAFVAPMFSPPRKISSVPVGCAGQYEYRWKHHTCPNLPESFQVAFDAGAKRILLPMASISDIPSISGELFAKFQTNFYADPKDAAFKALGVE